jgi:hypothetical protein
MTHPVLTEETLSQDWQHWAATLLHSKFDHGELLANEPVSPGLLPTSGGMSTQQR